MKRLYTPLAVDSIALLDDRHASTAGSPPLDVTQNAPISLRQRWRRPVAGNNPPLHGKLHGYVSLSGDERKLVPPGLGMAGHVRPCGTANGECTAIGIANKPKRSRWSGSRIDEPNQSAGLYKTRSS